MNQATMIVLLLAQLQQVPEAPLPASSALASRPPESRPSWRPPDIGEIDERLRGVQQKLREMQFRKQDGADIR